MKSRKQSVLMVLMVMLVCMMAMPVHASAAVKLNKKKATVYSGKTLQLKVKGTTQEVSWSSNKPSVASVSQNGKVKAVKRGTAVIAARVNGKSYKCRITVKQRASSVTLTKSTYFMMPGKTWTTKATIKPTNTNDKRIKWSSSNPSVAKVSSKGKVTAVANGNAIITATTRDGSKKSASCRIIVLQPSSSTVKKENTSGSSASAKKLLTILQKYSDRIKTDQDKGIKWTYSNSGICKKWSEAVKKSQTTKEAYSNCALMVNWAMREMGALNSKSFYGLKGGSVHYSGNAKSYLQKYCNIISVYKTPDQLLAEGNLLPGDICIWRDYQHTNVYAGDGLWYDSGRSSQVGGYQNGKFVFSSFGPAATIDMSGSTISYIIRLKK